MTTSPSDPLVLVDGSSYLYRAFHALPPLTNSRGEPTGAVYGVANMLRKLHNDSGARHMAVVFDAKGKTFRDTLFEQYKANRPPMPDDLRRQVEPLLELVEAMGFPVLVVAGVEADDVIGTLATQAAFQGMPVLISTGDKDMAQLVNERTTLVNTMTGTVLDRDGVISKFGVAPERIVDLLALMGDSSDNIPGIPKVGPKTAAKWLTEFGSLDEVVAHADTIPGKVGESLRQYLDQLPLAHELATIRTDLKLDVQPADLTVRTVDPSRLRECLADLEFHRWIEQLAPPQPTDPAHRSEADAARRPMHYEIVLEAAALDRWVERLERAVLFAFDTETTSLNYMVAELVGVSFSVEPDTAAYVPLAHDYAGAPVQLDREVVLKRLRPLLEDPERAKLGQNLKYDMSVLARYQINLQGVRFDTMLESYVLDSTRPGHDMDSLAMKFLGHRTIHYEDVAGKGAHQIGFAQVPIEQAGPYAAEDADITLRLHQTLWPRLQETPSLLRLFEEIEMPLVPVLSRIERAGVLVDCEMLRRHSGELAQRLAALEREVYESAGETFNLGSPKQLQEVLFSKMGLPVLQKTPGGQPSTAEPVLQELALDYPLPRLILEYRGLSKLKSTYTDRLPEQVNPGTGRVHTSYHQAVAATGRLSSSDPNLQNIPVRTAEGRRIRQAFVAPAGLRIVAADYSQIELRIMAHLSRDSGLLSAFAAGADIHRATASEVFGVPPAQVSDDQRRSAKAINFGLIYGMSAFGLARQLGIDRGAAQQYVDRYFARYPQVKEFMDLTREQARTLGYVETLFGRRLYLPEIRSRNQQRQRAAERTAINAPMQGTAADIIKRAMIRVDRWLQECRIPARMVMQVHDELVFEVPEDQVEPTIAGVRQHMAEAAQLLVPLVVDIGVGDNWDEAH
ncbi:MAG: DNA polymerase I [Chromatiales bacterium 21-64-14]|nr:MAG: DNA polymerase I [Chromatiales bacterium 21-64-14]